MVAVLGTKYKFGLVYLVVCIWQVRLHTYFCFFVLSAIGSVLHVYDVVGHEYMNMVLRFPFQLYY